MKKLLTLIAIALAVVVSSCSKFDDSAIWDKLNEQEQTLNDHEKRIAALEELCKQMNTNINALQTLVEALEKRDYITNVSPVREDGMVVGYTISFASSDTITIYNGKDGSDGTGGYTPQIGIKKDADGLYYWTLDGEWLLDDNGNKIKAVGEDGRDGQDGTDGANGSNGSNGQDGQDGEDGTDGRDGVDGITPRLKIENDYWYVSYDEGATWIELGRATGEDGADGSDGSDGEDGDSIFSSVTQDEEYVYFNLADGTMITLPKHDKENIQFEDLQVKAICCKNWDTNNDGELSYAEAAAVTDIGTVFKGNTDIIAFNELQYFTGLTYISNSAFYGCSNLWKVILPHSVTNIKESAFRGCATLSSINLNEGITKIGSTSFYDCTSLKSLRIPDSVTYIGSSAFKGCSNVTFVYIGFGNKTILNDCFYGCSGYLICNADIEKGYTDEHGYVDGIFEGASFNSVEFGGTLIGSYAFVGSTGAKNTNLKTVIINQTVNTIKYSAFNRVAGIETIYCMAYAPPVYSSMSAMLSDASSSLQKIYVPIGCADAYKVASGWSTYASKIEEYDFENNPI